MATSEEWGGRVRAWHASGLSAKEFCKDKPYTVKSLWQWSSQLRRKTPARAAEEVPIARLVRTDTAAAASRGHVAITVNGSRVEVHGVVEPSALRVVLTSLREPHEEVGS